MVKYLPEKFGGVGLIGADSGAKPKVTKKCTKWPQNVTVFVIFIPK